MEPSLVTVNELTLTALTVTFTLEQMPLFVTEQAVMVDPPAATPVTTPSVTTATLVLDDFHVTCWLASAGATEAFRVMVLYASTCTLPPLTVVSPWVRVMPVAAVVLSFTVQLVGVLASVFVRVQLEPARPVFELSPLAYFVQLTLPPFFLSPMA